MITRDVEKQVETYLNNQDYKIFFLWGPRRSGKTTILKDLAKKHGYPLFNFDFQTDRDKFKPEREALAAIAQSQTVILIDEVQNFPEATIALKLLHDEFGLKIIATGSSELRQKSNQFDSLAGRFTDHYCLPLSIYEIAASKKVQPYQKEDLNKQLLADLQIFGAYPEVYANKNLNDAQRQELLANITETYVLKDVIDIYNLQNSRLARDILTKIALQIGQEVKLREIANSLGANAVTISNYIEIFIKNYVLIPLPSFKTNARRAVSENRKLYFMDLGIRNALINDFRPLDLRPDAGNVFENFVVIEIEKQRRLQTAPPKMHFYREYNGNEVDVVLENSQKEYTCLEVKTNPKKSGQDVFPLPHTFSTINTTNYFDVIKSL